MKRVHAHSLILVNWKGVFYEHYRIDRNVTALEGDNGAGKTTVMIAAYVVMLPDMTRLRFTNVGENDAIGGDRGIWGRMGNPNRPSYSVMAFDLGGQQVLAGVHLERKGEPSVELTPFLVYDLPRDVRFQDALLIRSSNEDMVPELSDLRENVTRLGGRMQTCRTAKEYFTALFERGITPLRLIDDRERTRFNDMLRTSMTGGISRALTSDFRSFLLKEETGLADTLVRMRSNLAECRRTRIEVTEAQELEREISGIYEAGHKMFAAALLGTRERAEELRRRVVEAKEKRDTALRERDYVASDLAERIDEKTQVGERLKGARLEYDTAQKWQQRVTLANTIAKRVAGFDKRLSEVRRELETAASALKRADENKACDAAELTRTEQSYRRAAEGVADLQRGLEELHRRADSYRMVMRRLSEAKETLQYDSLAPDEVPTHAEAVKTAIVNIDAKRNELDAAIGSEEAHRAEHGKAMQALAVILGKDVDWREAHAEARTALRHLSELDALAARAEALGEELRNMRTSLDHQKTVRAKADDLSQPGEDLRSSREVHDAFCKADVDFRQSEERTRKEQAIISQLRQTKEELQSRKQELQISQTRWRELDSVALRLENVMGMDLRTAQELEAVRQALDDERDNLQRRREELERARTEAEDQARTLEQSGGMFHADILAARDLVGGELLASHFDEVDPKEAGQMQARLGPLSEAIVVDDARQAATTIAGRERSLDTIWLVEEGGLQEIVSPGGDGEIDAGHTDVIVEQNGVVRTTRIPPMPTLGRKARQRLIDDLNTRADKLRSQTIDLESRIGEITSRRRDTALLTREFAILQQGDPASEVAQLTAELAKVDEGLDVHTASEDVERKSAARLSQQVEKLRELLVDAFLLDSPDLGTRVSELERERHSAVRAGLEVRRGLDARRILGDHIDTLRRLPLSEAEIEAMSGELADLSGRRTRLFLALDALGYVAANREAIAWSDAEESLSAKQEIVPALKAQCENADVNRQTAIRAAQASEVVWEKTRNDWRAIDDRRSALEASRDQAWREFEECGIDDPSDTAVERASAASLRLRTLAEELDGVERDLDRAIAQLHERITAREKVLGDAQEHLVSEEKSWKPAEELWERLRARAETKKLLTPSITARLLGVGTGSVTLRSDARTHGKALDERLSRAKGGHEIIDRIRSWLSGLEQTTGDDYLQAWETVRDWLRKRIPAQIAEVDDPLEALERLRGHLKVLGDRLDDQERKLRGSSEDVARGIDVHIRNAQRQVRLLNRELEGVRFGTIRRIQIILSRDNRMEGVLRALREGPTQGLLFAPTMRIEEAMEELFNRHGGRGVTVGQKLLDYREYIEIAVEVQRQANTNWERVNPSRLSTGEAIGIGTALMMVVLTGWERDANLFRAKRSLGTLRLLFLDEANRLSQDNLEVLFELCMTLEMQLLIAAPEVAQASGCTTYRLVRREISGGGEEVVVSGRRAIGRNLTDVGT
ncbi:MAG: chromosome partition protein MukB [Dehalococcoidia bacterium]